MASDTRLNCRLPHLLYFIADCIQKTFYIDKANVGIQFSGIGYLLDREDEYPLSHFIDKLNNLTFVKDFNYNCKIIVDFFKNIINIENNTNVYIKGIIAGFKQEKSVVCIFNTRNSEFITKEIDPGQSVDNENSKESLSREEEISIKQIINIIKLKSKYAWWSIGEEVDMISITKNKVRNICSGKIRFTGSQKELLDQCKNDIRKINGKIINPFLD